MILDRSLLLFSKCMFEILCGHYWTQVQAENVQQAEALVRVADKMERLEGDLRDTQGLLGALHGAHSLLAPFLAYQDCQ